MKKFRSLNYDEFVYLCYFGTRIILDSLPSTLHYKTPRHTGTYTISKKLLGLFETFLLLSKICDIIRTNDNSENMFLVIQHIFSLLLTNIITNTNIS